MVGMGGGEGSKEDISRASNDEERAGQRGELIKKWEEQMRKFQVRKGVGVSEEMNEMWLKIAWAMSKGEWGGKGEGVAGIGRNGEVETAVSPGEGNVC